jgi:hypothetical protein
MQACPNRGAKATPAAHQDATKKKRPVQWTGRKAMLRERQWKRTRFDRTPKPTRGADLPLR